LHEASIAEALEMAEDFVRLARILKYRQKLSVYTEYKDSSTEENQEAFNKLWAALQQFAENDGLEIHIKKKE
jgi:Skp family chaperone for outer membrane proteins